MAKASKTAENQQVKSKVAEALDKLNKEYGQGSVFRIGDNVSVKVAGVVSSGSFTLDHALGIGGYPLGRIVEIYGPESSGKTTLCLHAVAEVQKTGKKAAIIDMEHAMDLKYAAQLGVNVDDLIFAQPDSGEEALNIAKELAGTGEVGIIIIDSVAALVPKSEADGEIGDSNVGKQARMISQAMRILSPVFNNNNVLAIFTNQIRMKIGVMFGSPETTAGGEALKFFTSVRIDIRKSVQREGDVAYGNIVTAKVVKNKVAPPFRVAQFLINYGEGIDKMQELVTMGVELGIINKAGSWYSYQTDKLGQGEDSVKELLRDNEDLAKEIETKIKAILNGKETKTETAGTAESSVGTGTSEPEEQISLVP